MLANNSQWYLSKIREEQELAIASRNETSAKGKKSASQKSKNRTSQKPLPSQELIAQRAYLLWKERGHHHGDDLGDWLKAKSQLNKELAQS